MAREKSDLEPDPLAPFPLLFDGGFIGLVGRGEENLVVVLGAVLVSNFLSFGLGAAGLEGAGFELGLDGSMRGGFEDLSVGLVGRFTTVGWGSFLWVRSSLGLMGVVGRRRGDM